MDERTKCLIVALEKLAKLGNGEHYGNSDGNMIAREALANYRIHKPTAPASLVEELREWAVECHSQDDDGFAQRCPGLAKFDEILSRYEPRREVVLAGGEFYSKDDWQLFFTPEGKCTVCNCEFTRLDGKRGKLIFVEDDK